MNRSLLIPLFVILALLLGACGVSVDFDIDRGSGIIETETRNVSGFDRVVLSGIGDLNLTQGDQESLVIEAEENVIPRITTKVEDGTLYIGFDTRRVLPTKPVKFNVTMRDVRGLETRGVSNISASDVTTDRLSISISGTGNINMNDLNADQLSINISGAGSLTMEGKAAAQKITMSGAGSYDGEDLQSEQVEVTISGLGKADVWVEEQLDVTISGTGGVNYYGNPQVSQKISGLGRLKDMGSK